MSWHAWSEVGYGYPLWNAHNMKTICRFLAEHATHRITADGIETLKRFANDEAEFDTSDVEDIFDEPVSWVIAGLMNDVTGSTLFRGYAACGDTDQDEYVGAEPSYPWTMNEVDKNMTSEKLLQILSEWSEKLEIDEAPDYFEAFYCG